MWLAGGKRILASHNGINLDHFRPDDEARGYCIPRLVCLIGKWESTSLRIRWLWDLEKSVYLEMFGPEGEVFVIQRGSSRVWLWQSPETGYKSLDNRSQDNDFDLYLYRRYLYVWGFPPEFSYSKGREFIQLMQFLANLSVEVCEKFHKHRSYHGCAVGERVSLRVVKGVEASFQGLEDWLTSAPSQTHVGILRCGQKWAGLALTQKGKPVLFLSRKLRNAEVKYATQQGGVGNYRGCHGEVLRERRVYLFGRHVKLHWPRFSEVSVFSPKLEP